MKYLVMVDQKSGLAEIREHCRARGTIEWDAANRVRAGGAIQSATSRHDDDDARPAGRIPGQVRAAGREIGGQALEGSRSTVTKW